MIAVRRRRSTLWLVALTGTFLCLEPAVPVPFRRGDANLDAMVDMADALRILDVLFAQEPQPDCRDAMDANDDGGVDVSDAVFELLYLFDGGAAPGQPFPDCGDDPTLDGLDCAAYPECVECETRSETEDAVGALIPRVACIPEDAVTFETPPLPLVGSAQITVCPAAMATPCGDDGAPGCEVTIDTVVIDFDLQVPPAMSFSVSGAAADLPVVVELGVGDIVCEPTLTFQVDGAIPLAVIDAGGEALEVVALGAATFDSVDVGLSVTGGLCETLASAAEDLVGELLVSEAADIADAVLAEAAAAIVGRVICIE